MRCDQQLGWLLLELFVLCGCGPVEPLTQSSDGLGITRPLRSTPDPDECLRMHADFCHDDSINGRSLMCAMSPGEIIVGCEGAALALSTL